MLFWPWHIRTESLPFGTFPNVDCTGEAIPAQVLPPSILTEAPSHWSEAESHWKWRSDCNRTVSCSSALVGNIKRKRSLLMYLKIWRAALTMKWDGEKCISLSGCLRTFVPPSLVFPLVSAIFSSFFSVKNSLVSYVCCGGPFLLFSSFVSFHQRKSVMLEIIFIPVPSDN